MHINHCQLYAKQSYIMQLSIQVNACHIKDIDSLKMAEKDDKIIVSVLNNDIRSSMPGNKYILRQKTVLYLLKILKL